MTCRLFSLALAACALVSADVAAAQAYSKMSCSQLWHRRNAIYARNGYCFQSARAIAAFGRGCFPPYGRLGRADAREVALIQQREARLGCPQ